MSMRVLNRRGARELTLQELEQIQGGEGLCLTFCHIAPNILVQDDNSCPV